MAKKFLSSALLVIGGICSLGFSSRITAKDPNLNVALTAVLIEFINTNENPKKPLAAYIDDMIQLLDPKKYSKVRRQLEKIKKMKNEAQIGIAIKQLKKDAPAELKSIFSSITKQYDDNTLLRAFRTRLGKKRKR